ncbi:MAG: hypothetical protein WC565_04660 [Parcubacteria group bacterium]
MTQLEHFPGIIPTLAKRLDRIERELNQLRALSIMSGSGGAVGTYTLLKTVSKAGISDNTSTPVLTITTVNETGNNDGGAWVAHIFAMASAAATSTETNMAAVGIQASIAHVVEATAGSTTALDTLHTGTSAAVAPASRDITTATITATDTSAYVVTVNVTIDWSGIFATTGQCIMFVALEWTGFLTPPVIAAA